MASLNKVMLIGNLGRDPEIRYTNDGTPVANFGMATTEKWTGKSGNQQESTEWHNIVVWNKLADVCKNYLFKGSRVYVEGKLKTRVWNDRDGNQKKKTEIVVSNIVLLSHKDSGQNHSSDRSEESYSGNDNPGGIADGGITDDDIPF